MKTEKKTDDDIQRIVRAAAREAIDYIEAEIVPLRLDAAKYYDGQDTLGHEEGRSKVVATKCRDAVRQVKPSLIRIFMASDKAVEFIPRGEEDVQLAEQQTKYANYLFNKNGGFRLLNAVIDDALRKKVGIAKVFRTEEQFGDTFDFEIGDDQLPQLNADDINVIEYANPQPGLHIGKAQQVKKKSEIRLEAVPPEEFFIDAEARSIEDFYVCGQQREMRVSDLVDMGFAFDDVADLGSAEIFGDEEKEYRTNYYDMNDESTDAAMRKVLYTEAYMRMDVEGTGTAQLYAFIMAGSEYKLLDYYPVDDAPFAVFEIDPEPHSFFGHSLVELVQNDQDAATALLRGVLDNVAMVNAPRIAYDEANVDADDMQNGEVGGLIRVAGSPGDKIMPVLVPDASAGVLSSIQYYDQVIDNKTGITRASAGMDPDSLQNANIPAVDAAVRAAQAQPETMARHLAEGGLTRLFRLLLRLVKDGGDQEVMMRLNGAFVQADPSQFDPELDVQINVGLGNESENTKIAALTQTTAMQMQIWAQYGPDNGLVTMTGIRNSLADALSLAGLHNVSRYYQPMNPEIEAQLKQAAEAKAAQQQQNQQPDPYVQGKQIEAQTRMQEAQMKAQQDGQVRMAEMARKDDLARDEMILEGILKAADLLGKYGIPVDLNEVYRMQQVNNAGVMQ